MSQTWSVLLPERIHEAGPESISDFSKFTSVAEYGRSPDQLSAHVGEFDAIILRTAELSGSVIEAAENLKIIAKHGAGLDNVDIETATRNGVVVCNTPGVNARAVAEHAVCLLFAVRRNVVLADRNVREGRWDETRADWDRFRRPETDGDVLGLVSFGNIARKVARIASGMGMECLTYDPYVSEDALFDGVTKVESQHELFDRSNVVSIHSPLTEETRHSIGLPELRRLGPEGMLVNTARGGIIDEEALLTALDDGLVIGAGLDVLEQEPPDRDHPLLDHDRTVVTPHIAGLTEESTYDMSVGAASNVRTVYEGGIPDSAVNPEALEANPSRS